MRLLIYAARAVGGTLRPDRHEVLEVVEVLGAVTRL